MLNEKEVEMEIVAKGLDAPRLTPQHIDSCVLAVQYHVFVGTATTVCCITLQNGFTVIGESACASPENYDKSLGEKIACENARNKIWLLEGYLLKDKLSND